MLSVASSPHACREWVGGDRDHRWSWVRGDRGGVQGRDSCVGGGLGAATDWLSWHRACPRQASVHNPLFFIITIYICYMHLRYRNFIETTWIDIPVLRVLLVYVRVAAMLRFLVAWVTCHCSQIGGYYNYSHDKMKKGKWRPGRDMIWVWWV